MNPISDESRIENLLEQIPPEPGAGLDSRLSNAPWTRRAVSRRRTLATVTIGLLTLALLMVVTPQGQTFAQTLFRYFVQAETEIQAVPTLAPTLVAMPENPLPASPVQPASSLPFEDLCGDTVSPSCTTDQIRARVIFPVSELEVLPVGWTFVGATGGPEWVSIVYRSPAGTMELSQGIGTSPSQLAWPVGSTAMIESVAIGNTTGEFVQGMWTDSGQNAGTVIWDATLPQRTLRWETGDILYTLRFMPAKSDEGLEPDKTLLVNLAAQLTGTSPFALIPTPTFVTDIQAVSEQAGYAVALPDWLPERFSLVNAVYVPAQNTVCLHYAHPGSEHFAHWVLIESTRALSLQDILLPPQFYNDTPIEIPVYTENVAVGGVEGQAVYASNGLDINTLCESQDVTTNHALLWQADGKSYVISAMLNAYDGRGFLTRLEMRRMAEGLTGVSTIPTDTLDPEYLYAVPDVDALAGFDVKAPGQMPAEMHFAFAVYREHNAPVAPVSMQNGGEEVVLAYFGLTFDNIERRHRILIFQNTIPANILDEMVLGGGEWVTVNGLPAVFSQVCWDDTATGGEAGCSLTLSWEDENGVRFDLEAYLPGALEKETLIAIAESMR